MSGQDLPVMSFASQSAWEAWLAAQHVTSSGIWLRFAKKDSGKASISHAEALEVALCHGWIDGLVKRLDEDYFMQRWTPRTPRSKWSRINCQSATRLIEQGLMRPAGLEQVERAKADGRWDAAYEPPSTATVPDDLARELEKDEAARTFFATLDSRNRYAILHRIHDAKKPETRTRRIAKFVAMLREGEKIYP
jgi:uncharacterized protein YdeI (YjbR/CyaY-like superfamily)